MTKKEYNAKHYEIQEQAYLDLNNLKKSYAHSNNPYKIGDIIEDHYHIIKIEQIKWSALTVFPMCLYVGTELTKKLKPSKKQINITMYQSKIIRKIASDQRNYYSPFEREQDA